MKLLRKPTLMKTEVAKELMPEIKKEEKKEKKSKSKLPSDAYKDEIDPIELVVDDSMKLIFTVKRGGELGLPRIDIRQFQTTELYTGFTKKGINFPIEFLLDFIEKVQAVEDACEEKEF